MLYRDYDQAALDAQYNARARAPDFAAIVERWARSSERARAAYRMEADVAYGPSPGERLDLFLAGPADGPPKPLHVFIHGGYWQAMDKRDFSFVAEAFVPAGAHAALINYTLAPEADMDEIVRQCRAAIGWLHRNAGDFGSDPKRLTVSGHSAGGHLTAMLLLTDWRAFDPGLPARPLAGGLAISGLYELEPIRLSYLNEKLRLDPESARRNSPTGLVGEGDDEGRDLAPPPLALSVGGAESEEFHRQQADFAAAWRGRGHEAAVVEAAGCNHFSVLDALLDPAQPLGRAARRLAAA